MILQGAKHVRCALQVSFDPTVSAGNTNAVSQLGCGVGSDSKPWFPRASQIGVEG